MSKNDEGSVTLDPREFVSETARRRHAQAQFREKKPIERAEDGCFRADCPWCGAPNVVMSAVLPSQPMPVAPSAGDAIQCDWCRRFHVVEQVNGTRVKTFPLELEAYG